jgi:twitching motility protein PilT
MLSILKKRQWKVGGREFLIEQHDTGAKVFVGKDYREIKVGTSSFKKTEPIQQEDQPTMPAIDIWHLLALTIQLNASDLHLSSGVSPSFRIDGDIYQTNLPNMSPNEVKDAIYTVMTHTQQRDFEKSRECDFSLYVPEITRFRTNTFFQDRGPGAVFRTIPSRIVSLKEMNAPAIFKNVTEYHSGIVLVTGPTGSGKSTTLAGLIDHINENQPWHILTIEDPIEFVHLPKRSLINQREVGSHTLGFSNALRSALREDPDVILVGELRDMETIRLALTAAETGHLVMATLHTSSAPKTVDRIIDVFPEEEKGMIRTMLSESLRAVISQTLLKRKEGKGRVAAHEVMIGTPAIRNLIRENKIAQITSSMQVGQQYGMQTLDQSLLNLLKNGIISNEIAHGVANNKDLFPLS